MEQIIILLVLIALGYFFGRRAETKHFKSIEAKEKEFLNLPAVTFGKKIVEEKPIEDTRLVTGSVVVSIDYFKRVLASLINIFGGEMTAYESLLDRARREAIIRMKEEAPNSDIIYNLRIETSSISKNSLKKNSVGSIEAIAYGTAITYKKLA